ncbi:MAG: hypothetical protein VYC39_02320 [Myxococcota bacterium]|nr:hypothetical protein [Myxococcota bacterium]
MTSTRAAFLFVFVIVVAACTPKQRAQLSIEVHRAGLTSIELVLLTSDNQEISRCRIYPESVAGASDACPFENGTDTWSGERRMGDKALSLLVYGDVSSNSIAASATGFIGDREVVTASADAIVFSAENTVTTSLLLPDVTAVKKACSVEFSVIAGMANFQSGPALNLVPSSTGHDLLFAGTGRLTRYRFNGALEKISDCSITDVDTRSLPALCNVRSDHLVVGPMAIMSQDAKEYAAVLCEPAGMNANSALRLHLAEYSTEVSSSDSLFAQNLGDSASLASLSPLVMGNNSSSDEATTFDLLAHHAVTSTFTAPVLQTVKLSVDRAAPVERVHEFSLARPVIQCPEANPCTNRVIPPCRPDRIQVLSQGCIYCKNPNMFTNPDLACADDTETLFQRTTTTDTLECLPKAECSFEQNLGNGINKVVAPYPPLFSRAKDSNGAVSSAILTFGYPGGVGVRASGTGRTEERNTNEKVSVFQPSIINEEGKEPFVLQDLGLAGTRNIRLSRLNLADQQSRLSRPTRISSLYQDLNFPKAYALGKTSGASSPFVSFGEFYLRRNPTTNDFETVLIVSMHDLDSPAFESVIRTATITFSSSSTSNGVHGVATILLGNIDADPSDTELVVYQPEFGRQIHAFKMNGSTLEPVVGFPLALPWREVLDEPRKLSVLMSDLDKDGALEIVALDKSQLQVFSLGIDSYDPENLAWPMERRDRQNSSRFTTARDPHLD